MTTPLAERDDALARLRAAVDDAVDGAGRIVLIGGEAGIGKTSLVSAFLAGVRRHPTIRVLVGACDDLITPRALGPFHDIGADAGPPLRAALGAGTVEIVHGAVLDELAAPTVLVVEDVHWADEATVDVLTFLARRIGSCPAVVVVTYRDDEVPADSPLLRLLAAVRAPTGVRLAPAPLSARAVCDLAGDLAAGLRVHASTGGNPFLVTEVLAAHGEGLPSAVQDAVLSRIAALDPGTQDLLALLAVVPARLELRLLDRLYPGWATVAEEAERRGMIEIRDGALAFRHELARLAVVGALPGARRLALGRTVLAALLADDPPDRSRILHHAVECGDAEAIATHGPAAARAATLAGAHRQALAHHRQLAPHVDRLAPGDRAAVTEEHAWELYNALRFADAVEYSRTAVDLRRRLNDPVLLGQAQVTLAWHLYLAARIPEAMAVADDAVAALEQVGDGAALARARSYRGFLWILADREDEGVSELDAVSDRADDGLEAVRCCYRGLGRAFLGDRSGLDLLRRGILDAEAAEQREFAALGYTGLVKSLRRLGQDDRVRAAAREGLVRTRETDLRSHGFTLEAHLYQLLAQEGRWGEAEEGLRALMDQAPAAGILERETLPHLGRLLMRRGDPEGDELLDRAAELARRADILPVLVPVGLALIERAWLAGDPEPEPGFAELLLARTDRPGTARYRGEVLRYLRRCGRPTPEFPGARPEHRLGLQGDWSAAAEAWREIGDPYERALELAESGLPGPTLEALDLLDELGAVPAARLVRSRLRDLGVTRVPRGPRPATRSHPDGLTERQSDVLALLGEGLTNGEIAARLVVSIRTVDHHVSAILTKLGVASRREAARLLASR